MCQQLDHLAQPNYRLRLLSRHKNPGSTQVPVYTYVHGISLSVVKWPDKKIVLTFKKCPRLHFGVLFSLGCLARRRHVDKWNRRNVPYSFFRDYIQRT